MPLCLYVFQHNLKRSKTAYYLWKYQIILMLTEIKRRRHNVSTQLPKEAGRTALK